MTNLATTDPFASLIPEAPEDVSVRKRAKNWLSRAKILAPLSKEVREKKGVPGEFMFGSDNVGQETPILVLARRDHALWIKDGKAFMESYDRDEEEYQTILAETQSYTKGAMEGYDYLFWSPVTEEFLYYHVAKTSLDYATDWQACHPQPKGHPDFPKGRGPVTGVLYSFEHPGSGKGAEKNYWSVPRVRMEPELAVTVLPTAEQVVKAMEIFNNPKPQGRKDAEGQTTKSEAPEAKKGGRARSKK